jgi:hypothetical protein
LDLELGFSVNKSLIQLHSSENPIPHRTAPLSTAPPMAEFNNSNQFSNSLKNQLIFSSFSFIRSPI